jgi:hypothetical protein
MRAEETVVLPFLKQKERKSSILESEGVKEICNKYGRR